jgi:hypothetical protein
LGAPGILEGEAKTLKKSGKMIEILYTEQWNSQISTSTSSLCKRLITVHNEFELAFARKLLYHLNHAPSPV